MSSNAHYEADFVINTQGAEAALKRLGVQLTRTLTGATKSVGSDITMSLRETGRYLKQLDRGLKDFEGIEIFGSKRASAEISSAKKFQRELQSTVTKLGDLKAAGRASAKDLEELDAVFKRFSRTAAGKRLGKSGLLKGLPDPTELSKAVGDRSKSSKKIQKVGLDEAQRLANEAVEKATRKANERAAALRKKADDRAAALQKKADDRAAALELRAAKMKQKQEVAEAKDIERIQETANKNTAKREKAEFDTLVRRGIAERKLLRNQSDRAAREVAQAAQNRQALEDRNDAAVARGLTQQVKTQEAGIDALQKLETERHNALVRRGKERDKQNRADDAEIQAGIRKHEARAVKSTTPNVSSGGGAGSGGGRGGTPARLTASGSGGGGRRSGVMSAHGGRGPGNDTVRGQAMPIRSKESAQGLLQMSSAAQGAMLAFSALDGNVTGLAFGLVFLSYGLIGTAMKMAALTVTVIGLKRAIMGLSAAALEAGQSFETQGQQLAGYLQNGKQAMDDMARSIADAKTLGLPVDEVLKMNIALRKAGISGSVYTKAIANAAGAGMGTVPEIAERFRQIDKSRPEQRGHLVEGFAREMDLPVKKYTSSLELADAMNKRFAGSAAAMATTTTGKLNTMNATWQEFKINLGVLLNEYLKPFLDVGTSFFQGMVNGFKDAFKTSYATGELKKTVDALQVSVRKLAPYLMSIGVILGRVIFKSAILAAKGLKVLADALRGALKWAKEYKDEFGAAGTSFKKNFLDVLVSTPTILAGVITSISTFFGNPLKLKIKIKPEAVLDDVVDDSESLLRRMFRGIIDSPGQLMKGLFRGIKSGLLFAVLEALALTVVDLLPISDSMKNSLDGIIRMTFTGAAIGSMFGPIGTVVGAALGASIGAGLELIRPGLSGDVMDWVDNTIISGLKTVGTFVTDKVVPALVSAGLAINAWVDSSATPAMEKFQDHIKNKVVPVLKDWASETRDVLMPVLNKMSTWAETDGKAGLISLSETVKSGVQQSFTVFTNFMTSSVLPMLGDISRILREKLLPALKEVGGWIDEHILPILGALWGAFVKLSAWIVEHVLPVMLQLQTLVLNLALVPFKLLLGALELLWPVIKQVVDWLGDLFEIAEKVATKFWDEFGPAIKFVFEKIVDLIELGLKAFIKTLENLNKIIADPWDTLSNAVITATGWVVRLWDWVVDLSKKIADIIWPDPPEWAKKLLGAGGNLWDAITPGGGGNRERGSSNGGGSYAAGGIIGRDRALSSIGTPGELILNLAQQRSLAGRLGGGGGGGTNIYVSVSDSVITNQAALEEFTGKVANKIASRMGSGKALTFHRI